ncbi:MAG: nitrilase-related carbon-nitrogen hydrolase [Candidatus Hadarchaeota archaeon]
MSQRLIKMRVKVTAVQMDITADKQENMNKAIGYLKQADTSRMNLFVLPEVFNTGFNPQNYSSIKDLDEELHPLLKFSSQAENLVVVAGVAEKEKEKLYSSAVIIHQGEITGKYRKNRIFPLTDEIKYFSPGDNEPEVYETPAGRLGPLVCYEVRFPLMSRELTGRGAQILVFPAQFPDARIYHWTTLLKARAIENQLFVVGVNCAGFGKSMIIDPWGEVLAEAGAGEEVITAEIDLSKMEEVRKKYPFLEMG